MNIFFCAEANANGLFLLDENEAHHATAVLRMKAGNSIYVFNGSGKLFSAIIFSCTKKEVTVKVDGLLKAQSQNFFLHIAIAPTKQMERMEWFVEKAVELGVSKITPIICQRSERKELKTERLKKIAMAACKQSKQLWLPQIDEAITFNAFTETNLPENKFIAWCEGAEDDLNKGNFEYQSAVFLIGPEGDFSPEEVQTAKQRGFKECALGNSILRSETAGVLIAALSRR